MQPSARWILVTVATLGAVLASAVALVAASNRPPILLTTSTATSTSQFTGGIFTTGTATVSAKPDLATVSAGVQSQADTATGAQSALASQAAKLISRIKSLGVQDSDLSTSGYWIGPTYSSDGQYIRGYQASEMLLIKWHSVDTVGKVLDTIVQEGGATQVSVGFSLNDPRSAQAQARTQAIADARANAAAMASAAGVQLGSVIRVTDVSAPTPAPINYGASLAAPTTQVPVGTLDVQVTVEVDYSIA